MTNDEPQFGIDDCTRIPFTRQTNPPRYLNRPTDTVDMISGWERGRDCPHHAPAVPVSSPPPDQTALRERIAEALWAANGPSAAEEANVDAVLAVLPTPADRTAVLQRAADHFDARATAIADVSDDPAIFVAKDRRKVAGVWREGAAELRRLAAEAQQPECTASVSGEAQQPDVCDTCDTERCETCHGCRCNKGDDNTCGYPDCPATRVKHSGPDTKFCVLCLSGEHERVDEPTPEPPTHIGGVADDCPGDETRP